MRVLILPTNTGQGHYSTSWAIKEYLDTLGVDTLICDVLKSGKKDKSKTISNLYNNTVNYKPGLFGMLYHIGELISSSKHHSPIYYLNSLYAGSLYEKIIDLQPDVIVCPHMFSAHAITFLIEKHKQQIPTMGILTDYTCSPFWEETNLNCYVVANDEIMEECVSKGMARYKLFPLGIPVHRKFKVKYTKEDARAVIGVKRKRVVTIMGGSMGYGKIVEIAEELVKRVSDTQVLVVCGNNTKAFNQMKNIPNATAVQFVDNVEVLMDATDVLLTKPGGLTTTEAMTKRIPLVITMPIPGGETRNSDFITKKGMAMLANTVTEAVDATITLLTDQNRRERMIAAQKAYCNLHATEDVGRLIMGLANNKKGR